MNEKRLRAITEMTQEAQKNGEYDTKPEPRTWWVVVDKTDKCVACFKTCKEAKDMRWELDCENGPDVPHRVIKVQEVE